MEGSNFIGVNEFKIRVEGVVVVVCGAGVINKIIVEFVFIKDLVGAPFNKETRVLDEGLVLEAGEVFKAALSDVGNGKNCGLGGGAGVGKSRLEGQESVADVGAVGAGKDDGAEGARADGVGSGVVDLGVSAEFKKPLAEIEFRAAEDDIVGRCVFEDGVAGAGQ